MRDMTIGAVAKAARVSVETLRYYQRQNLLEEPAKPLGSVRRYTDAAVSRVRFIKRAQELGFSLAEIRRLMTLGDPQSCGQARTLAAEKLILVKSRLQDLGRLRGALEALIARCDLGRGKIACPIIESLSARA